MTSERKHVGEHGLTVVAASLPGCPVCDEAESRLSHDRGADAERLPGPFDIHDHGCTCWPHVSAGPALEAVIEAARQEYAACSPVPAPTLPALDPMLLEKALGRVVTRTPGIWVDYSGKSNKGGIPASRKAFARALAKAYREALRDAV